MYPILSEFANKYKIFFIYPPLLVGEPHQGYHYI